MGFSQNNLCKCFNINHDSKQNVKKIHTFCHKKILTALSKFKETGFSTTFFYSHQILAMDANNASLNSSATITVNIMNENDNVPEFTDTPYHTSLLENSTANSHVFQVTVC